MVPSLSLSLPPSLFPLSLPLILHSVSDIPCFNLREDFWQLPLTHESVDKFSDNIVKHTNAVRILSTINK